MQRGFTLIELMVVIVILGGLVGLVGINVLGAQKDADQDTTRIQMANLGGAIQLWTLKHRRLPDRLEQLLETDPGTGEALVESLPPDLWGTPFEYRRLDASRFEIVSAGKDGVFGSDDDLRWPGAVREPSR